jgi:hypothetical protein
LHRSSRGFAARPLLPPGIAVHRVGIAAAAEGAQAQVVEAGGEHRVAAAEEEELAVGGEAADLVGEEEAAGGLAVLLGGGLLAVGEEQGVAGAAAGAVGAAGGDGGLAGQAGEVLGGELVGGAEGLEDLDVGEEGLPGAGVDFEDGVEGEVDLSSLIEFKGVFEPLRDVREVAKLRVDPEQGTVSWPNGADLDPDVLYAVVTAQPIGAKSEFADRSPASLHRQAPGSVRSDATEIYPVNGATEC